MCVYDSIFASTLPIYSYRNRAYARGVLSFLINFLYCIRFLNSQGTHCFFSDLICHLTVFREKYFCSCVCLLSICVYLRVGICMCMCTCTWLVCVCVFSYVYLFYHLQNYISLQKINKYSNIQTKYKVYSTALISVLQWTCIL